MTKNDFHQWTEAEKRLLYGMNSPFKIQKFLDEASYNATEETRSPRYILKHRRAHCMEGALFAAACLEYHGFPPLVLDMQAYNDDDHVIAVFKYKGCWGSIAKSNFTTIRFREPVYRTLRELSMSYFDFYFNSAGDKTLRGFSLPHNLNRFNKLEWRTTDNDLEDIGYFLDKVKHFPLLNREQIRRLELVGDYLLKSSLMGANVAGLFVPGSKKKVGGNPKRRKIDG
jgi:hypothetical protein